MTTTAQHTPGPWAYSYAPYTTQDGRELPAFELHGEGEKVCDTVEDQPIEAQEANARLIAAAPDLLAALDSVTAQLGEMAGYLEDCRDEPETQANKELEKARAAIAKARGVNP